MNMSKYITDVKCVWGAEAIDKITQKKMFHQQKKSLVRKLKTVNIRYFI